MQFRQLTLYCSVLLISLSSCNKYEQPECSNTKVEIDSSTLYVTLSAQYSNEEFNLCGFIIGNDSTLKTSEDLQAVRTGSTFTASFLPDKYGTTYYYRPYIYSVGWDKNGEKIGSFSTLAFPKYVNFDKPNIQTLSENTYKISCTYSVANGVEISEYGVCYSDSVNPTINNRTDCIYKIKNNNEISSVVNNLSSSKSYYFRIFVKDGDNVAYSECVSTKGVASLSVNTSSVSNITSTSAVCGGTISSDGEASVTSRGVVWSTSSNPTIELETKTSDGNGTGTFISSLTGLNPSTIYYVRAYAVNEAGVSYGNQETFTTSSTIVENEAIDLGLTVKWASHNIGANASEGYGEYYAWAEIQIKTDYQSSTYKWFDNSTDINKYNTEEIWGNVDNKTTIEQDDDVAHVKMGGKWRIPTADEWKELYDNCSWELYSISGVSGYKITSKIKGYSDKWIFIPLAGYRSGTIEFKVGTDGLYWSSSLVIDNPHYAYYCRMGSGYVKTTNKDERRHTGMTVRPVCEK